MSESRVQDYHVYHDITITGKQNHELPLSLLDVRSHQHARKATQVSYI